LQGGFARDGGGALTPFLPPLQSGEFWGYFYEYLQKDLWKK